MLSGSKVRPPLNSCDSLAKGAAFQKVFGFSHTSKFFMAPVEDDQALQLSRMSLLNRLDEGLTLDAFVGCKAWLSRCPASPATRAGNNWPRVAISNSVILRPP